MEKFFLVIICLCFIVLGNCFKYKLVDLTYNHGNKSIYWPTHTGYELIYSQKGPWGDGLWVAAYTIKTTDHLGTHLDAPVHFNKFSWTTHQIPLDHLVGPGVIIDVTEKVKKNQNYRVTKADVQNWEKKNGRIPHGAIVIMRSGWGVRYPDKKLVFGTNDPNDTSTFHFPSWHEEAVAWMIAHRTIHVLGVDVPSLDYGQSKTFPVHNLISNNNICGLENVGYVDKLPPSGAIISAAVMKIVDGSGSPARVFAMIPQEQTSSSNSGHNRHVFVCIVLCCMVTVFSL